MIRRMLRKERTNYGKNLRKSYEAGEVWESRHKMTIHSIRPDELANTLSTVLKDNLLVEIHGKYEPETKGERNLTKTNEVYNGKPFKYVELFAGIGGFRSGLDKVGGECVFAAEWDKFAQQSYTALYGGEHLHGDITKVNENDVPDHDILVFGMPCQAFSVAGKRLGFEDMRGTLYFEALRIAKAKKPKVLWMENVKGLISHDKGRTLDVMAQAMSDIGYTLDLNVINSKYFGVPQNRERIFMIGIRDDLVAQQPWNIVGTNVVAKGKRRISEIDGVKTFNFDWSEQTEVTTRLRDVLETEVDEKYYLSDEKTAALVAQLEERAEPTIIDVSQYRGGEGEIRTYTDVAPTLTAREYKDPRMVGRLEVLGALDMKGHRVCKEVHGVDGISPALTTMQGGHREPKIAELQGLPIREATKQGYAIAAVGDAVNFQFPDSQTRRGRVGKQIANTLEASNINQGVVTPKYRIRKLTPLECWRLQGFTDAQHQTVVDAGLSDSQRYKQAGNAVTVNVITAIAERIIPLLNGK